MAIARNEAPNALRGCGVRRGCPSPTGMGYAPPQNLFQIFELKVATFGAFW